MGSPEGHHGLSLTREFAAGFRRGRECKQAGERVMVGKLAHWPACRPAAEQLFRRVAIKATTPVCTHLMSFSAEAGVCVTLLFGALSGAARLSVFAAVPAVVPSSSPVSSR
jgi:hypothetical protein